MTLRCGARPKVAKKNALAQHESSRVTSHLTSRMEDVAREAGVARVTVSRALSDPDKVSPATLAAVRDAVSRLGYVPNLMAGSLASKRSRIVGAVIPTLANAWFADALDGLAETLGKSNYQLMLGQSGYRLEDEARLIDSFIGRKVDALMLTGVVHLPAVAAKLRRLRMPTVEIWDLTDEPIDQVVGFSNEACGVAVGAYLLARGRQRVGYIGADEVRSHKRQRGLTSALVQAGLAAPEAISVQAPSSMEDGAHSLSTLLSRQPALQAVFCSNDTLAMGALAECRKRGLRVPQDLAVVGFSDLPIASVCAPSLTSVRVRSRDIGRRAGELLLSRLHANGGTLEGGEAASPAQPAVTDMGFEIIERESS